MTQTHVAAKAYRKLLKAQDEYGSNCIDKAHEFAGPEPVSKERAQQLCAGCPLSGLGNPCQQYKAVALQAYGIYDGEWVDTHGDVEVGWEEEVEEEAMKAALGLTEEEEGEDDVHD